MKPSTRRGPRRASTVTRRPKSTCAVIRCVTVAHAQALCRNHYVRKLRYGGLCLFCGKGIEAGDYCTPDHAVLASGAGRSVAFQLLSEELEALREQMVMDGSKYAGRIRLLQAITGAMA